MLRGDSTHMPPASDSDPLPAQYLDRTLRCFMTIAANGSTSSHDLSLADRTLRLEVSKGAMEKALIPALAHLVAPSNARPDLTIYAWDSAGTGTPPLSPGWSGERYQRDGLISGFNDTRFHTAVQHDPLVVRMFDLERKVGLYWAQSASRIPVSDLGAPMRPMLHEWLSRIGFLAVHGGAVGFEHGGVFLAGVGGRGKSNIALACLRSDMRYASDDFCFLSRTQSGWNANSLFCSGKIAAGDLIRHPHLRDMEVNPNPQAGEKALFLLNQSFAERLIRSIPLKAIVLPRVIGSGPSSILPLKPAIAYREITISTIQMSRQTGRDSMPQVAELVQSLPCYEIQVGGSIADVPPLLTQLLSSLH